MYYPSGFSYVFHTLIVLLCFMFAAFTYYLSDYNSLTQINIHIQDAARRQCRHSNELCSLNFCMEVILFVKQSKSLRPWRRDPACSWRWDVTFQTKHNFRQLSLTSPERTAFADCQFTSKLNNYNVIRTSGLYWNVINDYCQSSR